MSGIARSPIIIATIPKRRSSLKKLALMIADIIPRKLPGGMKENRMDFGILDRMRIKEEVKFMLSFKKRRTGLVTKELNCPQKVRHKIQIKRHRGLSFCERQKASPLALSGFCGCCNKQGGRSALA